MRRNILSIKVERIPESQQTEMLPEIHESLPPELRGVPIAFLLVKCLSGFMSGNPRIMVVDDKPDLLRTVEMYLKAWKFDVDGFTDPEKALEYFQRNPTFFSLVLADVRMPKINGSERS